MAQRTRAGQARRTGCAVDRSCESVITDIATVARARKPMINRGQMIIGSSQHGLILPRFGGQLDYAASAATWAFNSNSIGLM